MERSGDTLVLSLAGLFLIFSGASFPERISAQDHDQPQHDKIGGSQRLARHIFISIAAETLQLHTQRQRFGLGHRPHDQRPDDHDIRKQAFHAVAPVGITAAGLSIQRDLAVSQKIKNNPASSCCLKKAAAAFVLAEQKFY